MRVAYIGTDHFASCAMALLDDGHEITHLFSIVPGNSLAPVKIADVARRTGLRPKRRPVTRGDLERVARDGAEAILCAGYSWRIPVTEREVIPALNVHPSPLPEGRGPSPFEWAIMSGRTESAVTVHQMVERFDAGPILWQQSLPLTPGETAMSLSWRARALAEEGVRSVFRDFANCWAARTPQGAGSYCKLPRRADRTLQWDRPHEFLDRQRRAFPPGRRYARLAGAEVRIGDLDLWKQAHGLAPGTVVGRSRDTRVVATSEGYARVTIVQEPLREQLRKLAWPIAKRIQRTR